MDVYGSHRWVGGCVEKPHERKCVGGCVWKPLVRSWVGGCVGKPLVHRCVGKYSVWVGCGGAVCGWDVEGR